jgi:integrase
MRTPISLAALLERFFTERLMQQRQASPHTISSYRDSFHQFLKFTEQRLRKAPSRLSFQEIDASLIMAFLDHLEKHQGLSTRSRNLRLTALRSFFRFAAFEAPTHSAQIQRVLAIPSKRYPDLGPISHTCRNRCLAGRSGSAHMVWPTGSRLHFAGGTDGSAIIRDDRA